MDKAPDAYRTISEVGEDLDIAQHVLRFWETRFPQIKPLKRGGGRRYYRPDDVELLKGIRHLLYREGYTIKGVQRILKEQGAKAVQAVGRAGELIPGLGPAVPDDSYEDFAPQPTYRGVEAPSLPLDLPPVSAPPEAAPARMQAPLTPAPYSAPMPPPAAAPRPDEGHVSYTRGGLAPRPAFSPVPEPTEAALASTGAPSNAGMRQALLDALGELESARAAIGQVLANRDRLSSE